MRSCYAGAESNLNYTSKVTSFSRNALSLFVAMSFSFITQNVHADEKQSDTNVNKCVDLIASDSKDTATPSAAEAKSPSRASRAPAKKANGNGHSEAYQRILAEKGEAALRSYKLEDFLSADMSKNLAVIHPFTVANAAEKSYAMLTHVPPRMARDPLYGIKPTQVYPMLTGHELAGGRMVVGNEEALDRFVLFLGSLARGDRSGKAFGFPGPAGTGKTELLYVIDNIERNLSKQDKYMQFSYRFRGLDKIPVLRHMFKFDRETGKPNYAWIDPDMPRSPFTLLREDMQKSVLEKTLPEIRSKWNMTISKGWTKPEPKTKAVIRAILEYKYPEIGEGIISVDDLTQEEYLAAINEFVVIVPKKTVQNKTEPQIIRAQTEDPNFEALFAKPNLLRQAFYTGGEFKDLAVDYTGQVFQQDGGLLMMDELYRNPESLLNLLLEVKQNRMVQTDYGDPVEVDIVPIWNSNDESIEKAKEDMALKASIDRDQPNPMRLLLDPKQVESAALFQVEISKFDYRVLSETTMTPLREVFSQVYPAPDEGGRTQSAYGRGALYYNAEGRRILIAPMALNYMAWLSAASRFEVNVEKMSRFAGELNMVTRDPSLFNSPITRLKIILGEREVNAAEKQELYRISQLLEEGRYGISSRDIETWFKNAINIALREGRGVLTPRMMDQAFGDAITNGEIKVAAGEIRAYWLMLRNGVKEEIMLPRLEKDVRAIISGDGDKANRIYDEIEREFMALAENPGTTHVTPDDGSQPVAIMTERLDRIKALYRKKYGREFSANFLLRNLQSARRGQLKRDPQLLETVREFLADQDALTSDYIGAFDSFYRRETSDPALSEKVGQVEGRLAQYGYDDESFKEAVAYVSQLRNEKLGREKQKSARP